MKREDLLTAALICGFLLIGTACAHEADQPVGILPVQLTSLTELTPGSGECELGALTADSVREATGADLAVVPAGDLKNDLPVGVVRWGDVVSAVGDTRRLAVADVTPVQLYKLLEGTLSHLVIDAGHERLLHEESAFDGFVQVSGFSLTVDASANAGERVYGLRLSDGTVLSRDDTGTILRLASTEYLLSGGYGYELDGACRVLKDTLADALAAYLDTQERLEVIQGRIRIIGVNDSALIRLFPPRVLSVGLAVIAACCIFFHWKHDRVRRDFLPMQEGETRRSC